MSTFNFLGLTPPRQYLVRQSATQGAQLAAVLTPIVYTVLALKNKDFAFARLLRACALTFTTFGPVGGAVLGLGQLTSQSETKVVARAAEFRADVNRQRVNDYTVIGAAVGGLVMPAVFLKRARLPYTIFGGACLGAADGVLTHTYKTWAEKRSTGKGVVEGAVEPVVKV